MDCVAVIGIGRLGLCVALCLEKAGHQVVGVDVSESYVRQINDKTLRSFEPGVEAMLKESKDFRATTDLSTALRVATVVYITVATPNAGNDNFYDHSAVGRVLLAINKHKICRTHIVIGSTCMPRYTTHIGLPLLADCSNVTLSYSPFFIAQGNIIAGLTTPDFVLIGEGTTQAGDAIETVWKHMAPRAAVHRMSPTSAEITKLGLNCFLTAKIAFANMVGDLADRHQDADREAIAAAIGADSRVGAKYLKPGYGFSGPCFPRDNRALGVAMKNVGLAPTIPEAVDAANVIHTQIQAQTALAVLREQNCASLIMDTGVCYKDNCTVPIIEESQKLAIVRYLAKNGIKVCIEDRAEVIEAVRLEYGDLFDYQIKK